MHWFWETLREFGPEERGATLQFVTGSRVRAHDQFFAPTIPRLQIAARVVLAEGRDARDQIIGPSGFSALPTPTGMPCPFVLELQRDPCQLPTASTCFHQLRLPNVTSRQVGLRCCHELLSMCTAEP